MDPAKSDFKNMELINTHDLSKRPAFQMGYQVVDGRHYLYSSLWVGAGFHILDVTDPKNLKHKFVPDPRAKPDTVSLKVQVADGIMVIGTSCLNKLKKPAGEESREFDGGIQIYDVKADPWNPKLLSFWDCNEGECFTGGTGTHRNFYAGGRYVHVSASCRNFINYIYRIVDIADLTKPVEVGRWWLKEQFAGGLDATKEGGPYHMHMAMAKGDRAYLAYCGYGLIILDISDVTSPKVVGHLRTKPPFSDTISLHTAQPLADPRFVLISSEHSRPSSLGFSAIVDVSNESKPAIVTIFPPYEVPEGAPFKDYYEKPGGKAGASGPHNWHSPQGNPFLEDRPDRLYHTCFNAGVRVYDIQDIYRPKEIAYFIPDDPAVALPGHFMRAKGDIIASCEDVLVDQRGYIYVVDSNGGLYILRCTV